MKNIYHTQGDTLIDHDIWLEPYRAALIDRHWRLKNKFQQIEDDFGSLQNLALGHTYFGFNKGEHEGKPGIWYREWAPKALSLALTGDFNNWERFRHPMKKDNFGVWSLFLPDDEYKNKLIPGSKVKVHISTKSTNLDRIPAYITKVGQDKKTFDFFGIFELKEDYAWKYQTPQIKGGLRIYEAHVGMAQEEGKMGNFKEFADVVLPRIKKQGYNAVQLMAVAQHPYYASFGYQVSNFFAVSHFMGEAKDLKALIDKAHKLGLVVLMDLVHSHTVKNLGEGINNFDGSGYQYFHEGPRGDHPAWDTKLFNYGKTEVLRFLLSNVRYWLEEFNFDGFRFDGVTSMIYKSHGLNQTFGHYDRYFDEDVDEEAVTYLQLANLLIHQLKPEAITIAEDVSGMAGMARPVYEGGIGFDYRLSMGIPDFWIKWLKHKKDEAWSMDELFNTMINRRRKEAHVAYAESHDQALVGDQTIAFRLMDKHMYSDMNKHHQNPVVDRGIALHNLIRLLTFSLGGEAWLNFMGNEFGHPEWIDFPRKGNNDSFHYARRQWSLASHPDLRYQFLDNFDRSMNQLDEQFNLLNDPFIEFIFSHEDNNLLFFRRGPLVFAFNFHPHNSPTDFRVGVPDANDYKVILCSDDKKFGGFERVKSKQKYPWQNHPEHHRQQSVQMYLPARTVQVLAPK